MRKARITIDGKNRDVGLQTYVELQGSNPDIKFEPQCIECGSRVHPYDVKGALGFRTVNLEVTRRPAHNRRSQPGFHHYDGNNGKDCPSYFAGDPRYQGIHDRTEFDIMEKQRNEQVLAKKGMRRAITDVQTFFMRLLTGEEKISLEDQALLDKITKERITMVGLADHPWILGYLGPLLMGSRTRYFGNRKSRVILKPVGQQSLQIYGQDGVERLFFTPRTIQLCFSPRLGKPYPMRRDGVPIEFRVSQQFAHNLVKYANKKRRELSQSSSLPHQPARNGVHQPQQLVMFDVA